jgi:hypothetical protein
MALRTETCEARWVAPGRRYAAALRRRRLRQQRRRLWTRRDLRETALFCRAAAGAGAVAGAWGRAARALGAAAASRAGLAARPPRAGRRSCTDARRTMNGARALRMSRGRRRTCAHGRLPSHRGGGGLEVGRRTPDLGLAERIGCITGCSGLPPVKDIDESEQNACGGAGRRISDGPRAALRLTRRAAGENSSGGLFPVGVSARVQRHDRLSCFSFINSDTSRSIVMCLRHVLLMHMDER